MTKKRSILLAAAAALALASQTASAALITLSEYAFNIDGTVTSGSAPAGVNIGAFNTSTGLGTITVTLTGAGDRYVSLFVDHEIDQQTNTFFNEVGSVTGTAPAGLSWEIDEPGFGGIFGDIYDNFVDGTLDNSIGTTDPDDVSMALAWDFTLGAGEQAIITFLLSDIMPTSSFYLTQTDPNSQASIYFRSSLTIRDTGPTPAPAPATLALLGLGLVGLAFARRREG